MRGAEAVPGRGRGGDRSRVSGVSGAGTSLGPSRAPRRVWRPEDSAEETRVLRLPPGKGGALGDLPPGPSGETARLHRGKEASLELRAAVRHCGCSCGCLAESCASSVLRNPEEGPGPAAPRASEHTAPGLPGEAAAQSLWSRRGLLFLHGGFNLNTTLSLPTCNSPSARHSKSLSPCAVRYDVPKCKIPVEGHRVLCVCGPNHVAAAAERLTDCCDEHRVGACRSLQVAR